MSIPKVIHQSWISRSLPAELSDNVNQLKARNPGWQHVFHDDADIEKFIGKMYAPRYLAAFRRINPRYGAARADFFRYLLLYRTGGVWLDIKSTAFLPLDQVLYASDQYVLSHWPNRPQDRFRGWGLFPELAGLARGEFQNWHIIAEPEHPFLERVIRSVLEKIEGYDSQRMGVGRMAVMRTTGPIAYTQGIEPLLSAHPYRLVDNHFDLGLRYNIFRPQGPRAHWRFFPQHYAMLQEPLVLGPEVTPAAQKSSRIPGP